MRLQLFCSVAIAMVNVSLANQTDCSNTIGSFEFETNQTKVLSRRKRFLIFPDGSSFQLVFCTQNHGYLQIGNIVWFGNTAALAWELPTDPEVFAMFRDKNRFFEKRRHDSTKSILYLDEDGMVIGKKPYRRNPIVNPAFAKRSIYNEPEENKDKNILSIKEMHEKEKIRNHYQNLKPQQLEFHRQTRIAFYEKVEKLLDGLGCNGRQCVLRFLCETAKGRRGQGTLLEEILKTIFTLPRGDRFDSSYKYDVAHGTNGKCAEIYADCKGISIMQNII